MLFKKILIEKSPGTDPKIPYWYMIFLKLPKRNFIIRSHYKDQIMEHPQFDQLNKLHTINWI